MTIFLLFFCLWRGLTRYKHVLLNKIISKKLVDFWQRKAVDDWQPFGSVKLPMIGSQLATMSGGKLAAEIAANKGLYWQHIGN